MTTLTLKLAAYPKRSSLEVQQRIADVLKIRRHRDEQHTCGCDWVLWWTESEIDIHVHRVEWCLCGCSYEQWLAGCAINIHRQWQMVSVGMQFWAQTQRRADLAWMQLCAQTPRREMSMYGAGMQTATGDVSVNGVLGTDTETSFICVAAVMRTDTEVGARILLGFCKC